jgi:uncharacterized membrane protein YbaN (DUF454 family)
VSPRIKLVALTPVLTTLLLEWANVGQLWRMWSVRSALGQNVWSWLCVHIALWLWMNFYRVAMPIGRARTLAIVGTATGIVLNAAVLITVAFFRYWVGNS